MIGILILVSIAAAVLPLAAYWLGAPLWGILLTCLIAGVTVIAAMVGAALREGRRDA